MTFRIRTLTLFIITIFFNACATYEAQYVNDEAHQNQFPDKDIDKTFYLVESQTNEISSF